MSLTRLWQMLTKRNQGATERFSRPGLDEFGPVAPYYDYLMRTVAYHRWVDYVEELLDRHQAEPRHVLDLACGTGKVGSEMLQRGYAAVGVDLSEPMARRCRRQRPPLPTAVMDARQLGLAPASLDLVVSLYDSLNYILQPAGLQSCFAGVSSGLRAKGLFIFDLNTARALRIGLFTQSNLNTDDSLQYSWKSSWDESTNICRVDMWFKSHGADGPLEFTETHYERAYEEAEVRAMLAAAGLGTVTVYNAYTFAPPSPYSDRVYYVARKD